MCAQSVTAQNRDSKRLYDEMSKPEKSVKLASCIGSASNSPPTGTAQANLANTRRPKYAVAAEQIIMSHCQAMSPPLRLALERTPR